MRAERLFRAVSPPMDPTWLDAMRTGRASPMSSLPRTSRMLSWLPTMTRVWSSSTSGTRSSARTVEPASTPSESVGMRDTPWARISVVSRPAPRPRGVATYFSPTRPMARRTSSSVPSLDGSLRDSSTSTTGRVGGVLRASHDSSGMSSSSKQTTAETGYPGAPTTSLPSMTPRMDGLPGMTSMPWTRTRPRRSMMEREKSLEPAEEPAPTTTTWAGPSTAARTAAVRASSLSGTGLTRVYRQPWAAARPAKTWELLSMTCPGLGEGLSVKSRTSSPVGMKSMRSRSQTGTSQMPALSRPPTS